MSGQSVARLGRDNRGAAVVEFALIAPLLLGLVLGVFQIGLYANNYSAVRSAVSDASRYAVVEYQKDNAITITEMRTAVYSRAVSAPYSLDGERLDVDVSEVSSEIGDARKFNISVVYAPDNFLGSLGMGALDISYARPVYVRKISVIP